MSRLSIIDEPEDARAPYPDNTLLSIVFAAISGAMLTASGAAVLVWLGWI